MNLPNKITIIRIFLIPLMIILYYLDPQKASLNVFSIIIASIYIIAALTDLLDGYIARKHELVTTFGKFLDPLADKLLVMTALLILLDLKFVPMWVVVIILAREFIVTGIRLIASSEGTVIAAGWMGKIKATVTNIAIFILLFHFNELGMIVLYIALVLTILSGSEYFFKNRSTFLKTK